jgi:hypothetical protein
MKQMIGIILVSVLSATAFGAIKGGTVGSDVASLRKEQATCTAKADNNPDYFNCNFAVMKKADVLIDQKIAHIKSYYHGIDCWARPLALRQQIFDAQVSAFRKYREASGGVVGSAELTTVSDMLVGESDEELEMTLKYIEKLETQFPDSLLAGIECKDIE